MVDCRTTHRSVNSLRSNRIQTNCGQVYGQEGPFESPDGLSWVRICQIRFFFLSNGCFKYYIYIKNKNIESNNKISVEEPCVQKKVVPGTSSLPGLSRNGPQIDLITAVAIDEYCFSNPATVGDRHM